MKIKEVLTVYAIGSIGYRFIEILWRGYTHWSMGIVGGICMLCIYHIELFFKNTTLLMKALLSSGCVTVIEFVSGLIINKTLGLAVWDYSDMAFNLLGQISLIYSVLWYLLCIPTLFLCKIIRHRFFGVLPNGKRHCTKIFERQPSLRQREP